MDMLADFCLFVGLTVMHDLRQYLGTGCLRRVNLLWMVSLPGEVHIAAGPLVIIRVTTAQTIIAQEGHQVQYAGANLQQTQEASLH